VKIPDEIIGENLRIMKADKRRDFYAASKHFYDKLAVCM